MFLTLRASKRLLLVLIGTLIVTWYNLNYLLNLSVWKDYKHVRTWQDTSESEQINFLAQKRSNLPVKFWYSHRQFNMRVNDSCALFPDIMKVHHVHEHWQMLESSQGNVKILGAYLDDRTGMNTVRVLTMIDKQDPVQMTTWCQMWFRDRRLPVIVPVEEYFYLWHADWYQKNEGEYQPYLLSCQLPPDLSYAVPSSVSLVENYCDNASNSLKVNYQKPEKKKGFAVCTKGNNFTKDITVRLVEWIELLVLLGIEKIYTFDIFVTPQVQKLYNYYTDKGYLDVTPLMLPEVEVNEPYFQHLFLEHDTNLMTEVIPFNHCFLQHMHEYEYIMVTDTDEVIMPKGGLTSYKALVNRTLHRAEGENVYPGSFVARNSYFFDTSTLESVKHTFSEETYEAVESFMTGLNIPDYMHMTRHLFRSTNFTPPGFYIKSMHSTDSVVAVHNHFHFKALDPKYVSYDFDLDEAYMHHYRDGCPNELQPVCQKDYQTSFVYDDSILKFYADLKDNVIRALDDLGYFQ